MANVKVNLDCGPATTALCKVVDCIGAYVDKLEEELSPDEYQRLKDELRPKSDAVLEAVANLKSKTKD